MARNKKNQHLLKARLLKKEKIITSIPKSLSRGKKAHITRLYNKYAEILESPPGEFKRVYTSKAGAEALENEGYARNGRYSWIPTKGAEKTKVKGGVITRQYDNKFTYELIAKEYLKIIGSDDPQKALDKKLKELKKAYKGMGMYVAIAANFEGNSQWRQTFPTLNQLLNYIDRFTPMDKKGAGARTVAKHKKDLMKSLELVIIVEPK